MQGCVFQQDLVKLASLPFQEVGGFFVLVTLALRQNSLNEFPWWTLHGVTIMRIYLGTTEIGTYKLGDNKSVSDMYYCCNGFL